LRPVSQKGPAALMVAFASAITCIVVV
jgi:hypothetical protein